MIKRKELTKKDIGKWVTYTDHISMIKKRGRIKSWNDTYVFVVYKCNDEWDRFQDFTGAPTDPRDLTFLNKESDRDAGNQFLYHER